MLTLRLHELTGDSSYADHAELTLHNALPHAQRPSGHFGCETVTDDPGLLTFDYAPEAWWCCTMHGLHAIRTAARTAVVYDPEQRAVHVNMLIPGVYVFREPDLQVTVESPYPAAGRTQVTVEGPDQALQVRVRIPTSSRLVAQSYEHLSASLYLEPIAWAGELGNAHSGPGNTTYAASALEGEPVSLFLGPVLLAADAEQNDAEDILRSRAVELEHRDGGFAFGAVGSQVTGRGHDEFRAQLILAPLAGQTFLRRNVTSRFRFHHARISR
jgi:hypothetical protein